MSVFYHPFITYTIVLATILAVFVGLYASFRPVHHRINPWIFLLPIGLPVVSYILNYIVISKTCSMEPIYLGDLAGFPSYHFFCYLNKNIFLWIGPLSLSWLLLALFITIYRWGRIHRELCKLPLASAKGLDIHDEYLNICQNMQLAPPALYMVNADTPILFTTGIIRKIIIFSRGTLELLNNDELCAALSHELAHIKRKGALLNRLLIILRDLTMFSPASFWAFSQFHREEEKECDALAAKKTGLRLELASALIKFMKWAGSGPAVKSLPGFYNTHHLALLRIKILLEEQPAPATPANSSLLVCSLILLALLLFIC